MEPRRPGAVADSRTPQLAGGGDRVLTPFVSAAAAAASGHLWLPPLCAVGAYSSRSRPAMQPLSRRRVPAP